MTKEKKKSKKSWGGDKHVYGDAVRMRNAVFKCCRIFDNSASQNEISKFKYMDLYTYIEHSRMFLLIHV